MPSADMRTLTSSNTNTSLSSSEGTGMGISSIDVENLVMEIKENFRLSSGTLKALPCRHLSRKCSRASPYRVPSKQCCESQCDKRRGNKLQSDCQEDPYELLQKLIRDGSLVNEAVRRVQLGLTPKQRYFYESDDDLLSPALLCKQDS